ncbi:MAG: disulfide bond formation protein B [Xanthobacteraceae bacterium]
MTATTAPFTPRNPAVTAALVVAAGGAATIVGALFFQYGLGLPPCPLCLEQRIPYYVAIPLAVIIAVAADRGAPRPLVVAGLGVLALAFLFGAGLAAYHAGIEWKWWPGPQDCSGPLDPLGSRRLLEQLQDISIVRCDEAPWRFLGLSLAGYNVLISLALAAIAAWGALAIRPQAASA